MFFFFSFCDDLLYFSLFFALRFTRCFICISSFFCKLPLCTNIEFARGRVIARVPPPLWKLKRERCKKNNEKPERVTCGTTIKALTRRLQSDAFVSLRSTVLWLLQLFIRTFIIIYHHQYFFWLHIIVITLETFGSSLCNNNSNNCMEEMKTSRARNSCGKIIDGIRDYIYLGSLIWKGRSKSKFQWWTLIEKRNCDYLQFNKMENPIFFGRSRVHDPFGDRPYSCSSTHNFHIDTKYDKLNPHIPPRNSSIGRMNALSSMIEHTIVCCWIRSVHGCEMWWAARVSECSIISGNFVRFYRNSTSVTAPSNPNAILR